MADFLTIMMPDGSILPMGTLLTVVALMFMYTFVGIVAGFGGALTTMPLISLLIPVRMASPISVTVGTATALYATFLDRKSVDWKSAALLIAASFVGIPFGIYVLLYIPDYIMKGALGTFLVIYAIYSLSGKVIPKFDRKWLPIPFGFLAGGLGAAFSTNGPPVVIYGQIRDLNKSAFRGTLNAFFTANNIGIVIGMLTSDILTIDTIKMVILSLPAMLLGWIVGQLVHKRLSKEFFQKIVYVLLIFSGLALLKGALGI